MKSLLAFVVVLSSAANAISGVVDNAWLARDKLGEEIWSEVVAIENVNSDSAFPPLVFATVFEFDDVLWFYHESNGTQSLSLSRGRLAQDKRDLLPLLRAIDPGFSTVKVLSTDLRPVRFARGHLPNGCFIDSLLALRWVARTQVVERAALLSYFVNAPSGTKGHTLLVFETARGFFAYDAAYMKKPVRLNQANLADEPIKVAREVSSIWPDKARWLQIKLDRHSATAKPALVARASSGTDPATTAAELSPNLG